MTLADRQAVTQCLWSASSWWHAGQLAWDEATVVQSTTYRAALFGEKAWGRTAQKTHLEAQTDGRDRDAAREILAWFIEQQAGELTAELAATEFELLKALRAEGFATVDEGPFAIDLRRRAETIDWLPAGDGHVVGSAEPFGPAELVEVHRASWHPASLPFAPGYAPAVAPDATSSFSLEKLRTVQASPWYRRDLHLVATAPDGSLAGSCIVWLDEDTGAALVEPLGVVPAHRRRGLAQALLLGAVDAVARMGGREVVIRPRGDDAYPAPRLAYLGCGFAPVNRTVGLRRPSVT